MKRFFVVLLALMLALTPIYAAIGQSAVKCEICGDTGVCVECEGDGECPRCYNGTGYLSACFKCKDAIPGKCTWCYGTKIWVSPTGRERDCPSCTDGLCRACQGTGLSKTECSLCMTTGKCYACGGDGGCPDCQELDHEARELREKLTPKLMPIPEPMPKPWIKRDCDVCLGMGWCESCGGTGYERCANMCKPSEVCFSCDGDGYKTCSACMGSGRCSVCGGSGYR